MAPKDNARPMGLATRLALLTLTALAAPAAHASETIYFSSQFGSGVQALTPDKNGHYALSTVTTDVTLPGGLAFDGSGNLFVSEFYGYNYSAYSPNGSSDLRQFTPAGGGTYTGSPFAGGLNGPNGLVRDSGGNLFVVENYDTNGAQTNGDLLKIAPGGAQTPVATGLTYADGVALDAQGDLFVTQNSSGTSNSGSVLKLTPGVGGYTTSTIASGLENPYGVAVNAAGDVFVANLSDSSGGSNSGIVSEYAPGVGGYTPSVVASGLSESAGAAVDSSGNLFVSTLNAAGQGVNTGSILEYAPGAGGTYTGLTPTIVASGLNGPLFLAFDNASPSAAPEPSQGGMLALIGLGLGGLLLRARRRRGASS